MFVLYEADIETLLQACPKASDMKHTRLADVTPIDIYDQRNVESSLSVVDLLAKHCDKLKMITVPLVFNFGSLSDEEVLSMEDFSLGRYLAHFDEPRYSIPLILYNENYREGWRKFLEDVPGQPLSELTRAWRLTLVRLVGGAPTEEELILPMSLRFAVFESLLKLYDHDISHPEGSKQFEQLPEHIQQITRILVEDFGGRKLEYRKLGTSDDEDERAWLTILVGVVVETVKSCVA